MSNKQVTVKKSDQMRQMVWGEVYVPNAVDSQGDYMTAEAIEKAAYNFLRNGHVNQIDSEHSLETNGSAIVESFVARKGDPDFIEGSWVLGVHVADPEAWAGVLKGDFNGFSMYGSGERVSRTLEIDIPEDGIIKGDTQHNHEHFHGFSVGVQSDGTYMGGQTLPAADGHVHRILKGSATETAAGHSHRFNFIDSLMKSASQE